MQGGGTAMGVERRSFTIDPGTALWNVGSLTGGVCCFQFGNAVPDWFISLYAPGTGPRLSHERPPTSRTAGGRNGVNRSFG